LKSLNNLLVSALRPNVYPNSGVALGCGGFAGSLLLRSHSLIPAACLAGDVGPPGVRLKMQIFPATAEVELIQSSQHLTAT
jgi:hypothetical protein